MKLELYTNSLSPFARMIELQLAMKQLEYERHQPDRDFVRDGAFGDINPLRKVPTLVVDGKACPETQVIFDLVEDLWPTPSLLPADPAARSQVRLLTRIADIYLATPAVALINVLTREPSADRESDARAMIQRGFRALERWLDGGDYAAGGQRSIADCALAPSLFAIDHVLPALGGKDLPRPGEKVVSLYAALKRDELIGAVLKEMETQLAERLSPAAQ